MDRDQHADANRQLNELVLPYAGDTHQVQPHLQSRPLDIWLTCNSRLAARGQSLSFIACSVAQCLYYLMEIKARILDCPSGEAHIVRRLGKAVVVQWDSLPKPVQDLLLKQAVLMHDQERTLQLRQKIKTFIQKWKIVE